MDKRKSYDRIVFDYEPMFQLMREKGITDLQLARKIGVKVDEIRNIQLRPETTTIKMIKDICKELDCGICDLIEVMHVEVIPGVTKD